MTLVYRRIFKSKTTGSSVLNELLTHMFIAEFMKPSSEFWIISPWISDVNIIDNTSSNFDILNPDWKGRYIKLSEIIIKILSHGTNLHIITRHDQHNQTFINLIKNKSIEEGLTERLVIKQRDLIHSKGILSEHGCLSGSMNITISGLQFNEEKIDYITDPIVVNEELIYSKQYLGGDDGN